MSLNNSQNEAINHVNGPAMVLAGPGSGKTLVITKRTKNLISKENIKPIKHIGNNFYKSSSHSDERQV